jgi:hypothetical protein
MTTTKMQQKDALQPLPTPEPSQHALLNSPASLLAALATRQCQNRISGRPAPPAPPANAPGGEREVKVGEGIGTIGVRVSSSTMLWRIERRLEEYGVKFSSCQKKRRSG